MDLAAVVEAALDAIRPAADAKPSAWIIARAGSGVRRGRPARSSAVIWNLLVECHQVHAQGDWARRTLDCSRRAESHVELAGARYGGEGSARSSCRISASRFRQAGQHEYEARARRLGLGLGIVRHLSELHAGRCAPRESWPEGGRSTFVVLPAGLPACAWPVGARPEATAAPRCLSLDELPALDGVRVLVVDASPTRGAGVWGADSCSSGRPASRPVGSVAEAVDVFAHELPDVLLSAIAHAGRGRVLADSVACAVCRAAGTCRRPLSPPSRRATTGCACCSPDTRRTS